MTRRAAVGVTVFDGSGADLVPDLSVIWDDAVIERVGPASPADLEGVEVVRRGGHVVPGLVDAHVHLCLDGTLEMIEGVAAEPVERTIRRCEHNAARLLAAGVTSARDVGSRDGVAVGVAERLRTGALRGTRVQAAGRGITPTGGHGWMIGVYADGPAAVAAAVEAEIRNGAGAVKLFPTGGVLGSGSHGGEVTMTVAEVRAAVEVAHEAGVLVAAHTVGTAGVEVVLEGGVDTIEHAVGITPDQATRCVEQRVALVPTLTAIDMLQRNAEHLPAEVVERADAAAAKHGSAIAAAIEQGVTMLAGTDAGTPFNPHGLLVRELELLVSLGMDTATAIRAATSLSADTLRLGAVGRVTPGALADLLVVDADPLEDVTALFSPALVIQGGTPIGDAGSESG